MTAQTTTTYLQGCLDRFRAGEPAARDELLRHAQNRIRKLTGRMLARYPHLRRWEQTDDVLQRVLLRVDHLLDRVEVRLVRDFLRLTAVNIRHVLIDLVRHYFGPHGVGANHATPPPGLPDGVGGVPEPAAPDSSDGVLSPADWGAFHEQAAQLADDEREVVDLLWYHGLTQEEAATLLDVSVSTVKRRWQQARLSLMAALGGRLPVVSEKNGNG